MVLCGLGISSPVTGSTETTSGARAVPFESKISSYQKGEKTAACNPCRNPLIHEAQFVSLSEIICEGRDGVRIKKRIFLLPFTDVVHGAHGDLSLSVPCLHKFHNRKENDVSWMCFQDFISYCLSLQHSFKHAKSFFFPVPYRRVKERRLSVLGHLLHFIVSKHMQQYYKGDKHIRKTLTHWDSATDYSLPCCVARGWLVSTWRSWWTLTFFLRNNIEKKFYWWLCFC